MSLARQLDFLTRFTTPRSPAPAAEKVCTSSEAALVKQAQRLLRDLGCDTLAAKLKVSWNARMRSTAGMAYASKALITLNPKLRAFGDDEVDRTMRHELAHLLAHHRAGRRRISPHGPEWQQACRDLGLPDEKRCHTLPLPRRQVPPRHFYRCPGCQTELPRVRPFTRKTACFPCCKKHNRGQYDERFRFFEIAKPSAP